MHALPINLYRKTIIINFIINKQYTLSVATLSVAKHNIIIRKNHYCRRMKKCVGSDSITPIVRLSNSYNVNAITLCLTSYDYLREEPMSLNKFTINRVHCTFYIII